MKGRSQVVIEHRVGVFHSRHLRRPTLVPPTSRGVGTGPDSNPVSHLVEPSAELPLRPCRAGLLGQNEKSRLERVFGVGRIAQNAPADGQHHGPVPRQDRRESRFVAPSREAIQKLSIGETRRAPLGKQPLDLLESSPELRTGHDAGSSLLIRDSTNYQAPTTSTRSTIRRFLSKRCIPPRYR
jgi:hypothetical protein